MNFPCRPLIAGIIIQLWIMEPGRLMIRRLVFLARVQKRAGSTTHHLSTLQLCSLEIEGQQRKHRYMIIIMKHQAKECLLSALNLYLLQIIPFYCLLLFLCDWETQREILLEFTRVEFKSQLIYIFVDWKPNKLKLNQEKMDQRSQKMTDIFCWFPNTVLLLGIEPRIDHYTKIIIWISCKKNA